MVTLDMTRQLTRGKTLGVNDLFSFLNPLSNDVTLVWDNEGKTPNYYAQASLLSGSQSALMAYLAAQESADVGVLACLIEKLVKAVAEKGAIHLTTEVETSSNLVEVFRRLDFTCWARERFWQLNVDTSLAVEEQHIWRQWQGKDVDVMRGLYQKTVPALFQAHEPLSRQSALGWVLYGADQKLIGYADLVMGPRGLWVQPVLKADASHKPEILLALAAVLPSKPNKPVYFCVRSYQPWLVQAFQALGAAASPEYALMVKYMALRQKAENLLENRLLERKRGENGVPVARIDHRQGKTL